MKRLLPKHQAGLRILYKMGYPIISKQMAKLIKVGKRYNPKTLHQHRIWMNPVNNVDANGESVYTNGIQVFPYVSNRRLIVVEDFDKDPNKTLNAMIEEQLKTIPSYQHLDAEGQKLVYKAIKDKAIDHLGSLTAAQSSGKIFSGMKMKNILGENYWRGISHEMDHAFHMPTEPPEGFKELPQYFSKNNGTELAARGSQLKDYFGFQDNKQLTPMMLMYAKDNYVKDTGFDNDMTEFFNLINNYEKAANWLSKHASTIIPTAGIVAGGPYYNNNK